MRFWHFAPAACLRHGSGKKKNPKKSFGGTSFLNDFHSFSLGFLRFWGYEMSSNSKVSVGGGFFQLSGAMHHTPSSLSPAQHLTSLHVPV